jgi:membrane fusion protein YbhG
MKKRIFLVLLVVAAGVAVWLWRTGAFSTNTNRILVSGNLELTEVDLSFKMAGKLAKLNVREGDWVKAGDVIARLDDAALRQELERNKASIAGAESAYQQLQTSIEYEQATLETNIAARQADVNQRQAKLDELLAGSRKQEIQQAKAAVNDAKAQNDQAKSDWERAEMLHKTDDISASQYDAARTRMDSTGALLRQAQEHLSLVEEGPRKEDIAAARDAVAQARAALGQAQAQRLELRRKQEQLVAAKANIDGARAQAGITQTQIDDSVIIAPINGVIEVKSAEAGEVLAAGTTVVTLGDLDHPWLRAYINETDLGRVKLGQKVRMSTDSYPGKAYWGRISFISPQAEFTPKQIQTKEERVKLVYRIKVDVDNYNHELKNNMPVDAEIVL